MGRTVGVVIAIAARIAREGVAALLQRRAGITIVGQAHDWVTTSKSCLQLRPDVLILSTRIKAPDGSPGIALLQSKVPHLRVLAFSPHDEETCHVLNPSPDGCPLDCPDAHRVSDLVHCQRTCLDVSLYDGALGAIRIGSCSQDVYDAVRTVARGQVWLEPNFRLVRIPFVRLSSRERAVARLVGLGNSNKEIATALAITEETTKKHISHTLRKLGMTDRLHLGISVVRHPSLFSESSAPADRRPLHLARS